MMHLRRYAPFLMAGAGVLWLALHLMTLAAYPPPTCDESFYARSALQYADALAAGQAHPAGGLFFYLPHGRTYWLLMWTSLGSLGRTLFAARLISLLGVCLAAAGTYLIGRSFTGSPRAAAWSALLMALCWLSLFNGHRARPDMLAAGLMALWLGLLPIIEQQKPLAAFVFGLASFPLLDVHLILLHLLWPAAVLAVVLWLQRKAWPHLIAFATGGLIAGLLLAWVHTGAGGLDIAAAFVAAPSETVRSYIGGGSSQTLPINPLLRLWAGLRVFWGDYLLWPTDLIALPQVALIVVGLGTAPLDSRPWLRRLWLVMAASSLSYAYLNANYQLIGYAAAWLPGYFVLGVGSLEALLQRLQMPVWPAWLKANSLGVVLGGVAALYVAGGLYLIVRFPAAEYRAAVQTFRQNIEPGARVVAASYWWFALQDQAAFVDETLTAPEGSSFWWNGVPALPAGSPLPAEPAPALERAAVQQQVQARLESLQPDYIIADGAFGCASNLEAYAEAITAYAERRCTPVASAVTGFEQAAPEARYYGPQTLYACPDP